jgi:hypothetical protein
MDHERDELRERRAARLSPAGRALLAELERALDGPEEPDPDEMIRRIEALPPSDQAEFGAILSGMETEAGAKAEEHRKMEETARQAVEIIRRAQEQDRAAGRPVDENMTVAKALEKLEESGSRTVPAYYPDFSDAEGWREYDGSPQAKVWADLMDMRDKAIWETVALVRDVAGEQADAFGVAGALWNVEPYEVAEIVGEPYEEG